jgi:putative hemolysin
VGPLTAIAIAAILLLLRSLLWAGDAALSRVSLARARELSAEGGAGHALFQLKASPEDTAASIRVGLTVNLVFATCFAAFAGTHLHFPVVPGSTWDETLRLVGPALGGAAMVMVATMTDLVARALGGTSGERYALRIAPTVRATSALFGPLLRSFAGALELALAPFGAKVTFAAAPLPLEEIERLLAEEAGKRIDQKAPALIHSIFELSEKSARDVMIQRTEIVAVELGTPTAELIRLMSEDGHSRMPVYKEDVDHIIGILHARDLVPLLNTPELIVLQDLLRPATFVPWSKKIGELLREMQKKRIHMSMVVDEYGGFMGLVTLEDILREIVGEFGNEYEQDGVADVESLTDGTLLIAGSIALEELSAVLSVRVPEGEYETLSGFLYSLAGTIPEVGDRFFFEGLQFTVSERTPKQIKRVRVMRIKRPHTGTDRPAGS